MINYVTIYTYMLSPRRVQEYVELQAKLRIQPRAGEARLNGQFHTAFSTYIDVRYARPLDRMRKPMT